MGLLLLFGALRVLVSIIRLIVLLKGTRRKKGTTVFVMWRSSVFWDERRESPMRKQ